ncbi:Conserved_hypothetical protein [Hexamita inflata]|uniref:Uncharacterized protein n=1 Tax=Hexamita inflata TaxID=28002 RepID=A0AA86QI55_9EUKA|nr:Conserved hypothetical protein [Hexamita inflata]
MPKSINDVQSFLTVIADYLQTVTQWTSDQLIQNHTLLNQVVCEHQRIPWKRLAGKLGIKHQQLYRWYFDTFQRNLCGHMAPADMQLMRHYILMALQNDSPLNSEFQELLKSLLSKKYQRNVFTVAFNNTKRVLHKQMLTKSQKIDKLADALLQKKFENQKSNQ